MMSITAALVVLGALVVLLIKTRWLRFSGAVVCVVFGVVLALSPMGPASADVLDAVGSWAYDSLESL